MGCEFGFAGADECQGGDPGNDYVVSDEGCFPGAFYRRREGRDQGMHQVAIRLRLEVDGHNL